jgi:hypothetical protein
MPIDVHAAPLLASFDAMRERVEAGPYLPITEPLDGAAEKAIDALQEVARTMKGARYARGHAPPAAARAGF